MRGGPRLEMTGETDRLKKGKLFQGKSEPRCRGGRERIENLLKEVERERKRDKERMKGKEGRKMAKRKTKEEEEVKQRVRKDQRRRSIRGNPVLLIKPTTPA